MKRVITLLSLCLSVIPAFRAADNPVIRIMPLGDSLTLGYSVPTYISGYRDMLYALLVDAGYNVDFVGTLVDTNNPLIQDPHHEGHGGYRIDQIDSGITGWLNAVQTPDVILLLIGTNDFWQGFDPAGAPNRLQNLLNNIAAQRPNSTILLASLPPRTDSTSLEAAQVSFNALLPGIVANQVSLGHLVGFVDIHASLGSSDLSSDGVHLNEVGYDKVAVAWLPVVASVVSPGPGVLANGSFEFDYTSWVASGNQSIVASAPFQASDGTKAVAFNAGQATPNGVLSQSFATSAGQTYTLTFDAGAFSFVNQNEQRMQVTAQGTSALLTQTVSIFAPGNGTRYLSQSFSFVANSAQTTLTFQDVSTNTQNTDLILDNVRVSVGQVPVARTLTVTSSTPDSGVTVTVSPADNNAAGNGVTSFSRVYAQGTVVTLTAPATAGGNPFQKWQKNGVDLTVSATTSVTMDADHALRAVYVAPVGTFANGSFESDYTSWVASGNQSIVASAPFQASDGTKAVAFNAGQATPNGVLSQSFATSAGQTYTLTFDAGAFSFVNQNEQRMQVTAQGTSALLTQTVSIFAPGNGTRYLSQSFSFVANSAQTTLTFQDVSTNTQNTDLILDNVRIAPSP